MMFKKNYIILFCLIINLFCPNNTSAEFVTPVENPAVGMWHQYNYDAGFFCISVDYDNTVWIGSSAGILIRKDNEFINAGIVYYFPYVTDIAFETTGKKWFVRNTVSLNMSSYIDCYDGENLIEYSIDTIFNTNPMADWGHPTLDMVIDKNNTKWFAHGRFGIVSYDGNEWKTHYAYGTINVEWFDYKIHSAYDIAVDNDNVFWYIASEGAWRLNDDVPFISYSFDVYSVDVGPDNVKWFGGNGSIWRYDGKTRTFFDIALLESNIKIKKTVFGNQDEKWFLSDNCLFCFDDEKWLKYDLDSHITLPDGYTGELPTTVDCAVDLNGIVWICMTGGYILSFEPYGSITEVNTNNLKPTMIPALSSFPNPFNPTTTIEFTLPEAGFMTLTIYNIAGQKVRELASERMTAGTHRFQWDGKDNSGSPVSAGVYIARLKAGEMTATGKLVLVK